MSHHSGGGRAAAAPEDDGAGAAWVPDRSFWELDKEVRCGSACQAGQHSLRSARRPSRLSEVLLCLIQVKSCMLCDKSFTAFRRRHHCRECSKGACRGGGSHWMLPWGMAHVALYTRRRCRHHKQWCATAARAIVSWCRAAVPTNPRACATSVTWLSPLVLPQT